MIIGITGSFGSGKTTIANIFRNYGFKVINVDRLYHNIYNKPLLKIQLKKEFNTTNRNKIKKIVFNNSQRLKKLNKITHPMIIKEIKNSIKDINKKNKNIIIDAPLLLEAKAQNLVDKIIVVKANKKNTIKRILKCRKSKISEHAQEPPASNRRFLTKKKYSKKEIEQIMKSQMPLKQKLKHADFVVDNNKSVKDVREQVKRIVDRIRVIL